MTMTKILNLLALGWMALKNQIGAFSITNRNFATPDAAWIPACHTELADQTLVNSTLTTATVNTGIVGLKWIRVRFLLKTLGGQAAGETIRVTAQAGTGAAITTPVNIGQRIITMETGDTAIAGEFIGWSNAGFQSYALLINSSGAVRTPVLDIQIDCA
jgi:hypothetical protein